MPWLEWELGSSRNLLPNRRGILNPQTPGSFCLQTDSAKQGSAEFRNIKGWLGNMIQKPESDEQWPEVGVACRKRLGGMLKYYRRKAA
jgi:hypothetical protein